MRKSWNRSAATIGLTLAQVQLLPAQTVQHVDSHVRQDGTRVRVYDRVVPSNPGTSGGAEIGPAGAHNDPHKGRTPRRSPGLPRPQQATQPERHPTRGNGLPVAVIPEQSQAADLERDLLKFEVEVWSPT